ncbi:hypothetical protein HK098_003897 [Nowakowskiella sp. JEL0407]|nr:hypothetical protein HK098_003897 [Nowakowskiella sp. JEL0407]
MSLQQKQSRSPMPPPKDASTFFGGAGFQNNQQFLPVQDSTSSQLPHSQQPPNFATSNASQYLLSPPLTAQSSLTQPGMSGPPPMQPSFSGGNPYRATPKKQNVSAAPLPSNFFGSNSTNNNSSFFDSLATQQPASTGVNVNVGASLNSNAKSQFSNPPQPVFNSQNSATSQSSAYSFAQNNTFQTALKPQSSQSAVIPSFEVEATESLPPQNSTEPEINPFNSQVPDDFNFMPESIEATVSNFDSQIQSQPSYEQTVQEVPIQSQLTDTQTVSQGQEFEDIDANELRNGMNLEKAEEKMSDLDDLVFGGQSVSEWNTQNDQYPTGIQGDYSQPTEYYNSQEYSGFPSAAYNSQYQENSGGMDNQYYGDSTYYDQTVMYVEQQYGSTQGYGAEYSQDQSAYYQQTESTDPTIAQINNTYSSSIMENQVSTEPQVNSQNISNIPVQNLSSPPLKSSEITCPQCSSQCKFGARFCSECGCSLANVPSSAAKIELPKVADSISPFLESSVPASAAPPTVTEKSAFISNNVLSGPPVHNSSPFLTSQNLSNGPPINSPSIKPQFVPATFGGSPHLKPGLVPNTPQQNHTFLSQTRSPMVNYASVAPPIPTYNPPPKSPQEIDFEMKMRGHALVSFGFGKLVVTMPKRQNRYTPGPNGTQNVVEKSYPGKVSVIGVKAAIHEYGEVMSEKKQIESFPGPIMKMKKKDVLKLIDIFIKKEEEKGESKEFSLLRFLKVVVEHDGNLLSSANNKANANVLLALQGILALPEVSTSSVKSTPLDEIESLLLKGDRSGACDVTVAKELWAHALIIASNVDKDKYNYVVTEFLKAQFGRGVGGELPGEDRPALQVIYGLFGGLGAAAGNIGAKVERSSSYMLSLGSSPFSGVDANNVRLVLLGANHIEQPYSFFKRIPTIHMTELFEFSQTLIPTSNGGASSLIGASTAGFAGIIPHLQGYKLYYAMYLADMGYLDLALRYCESIETVIKSYPRGSPYFHRVFLERLRDLLERLSTSTTLVAHKEALSQNGWFTNVAKYNSLFDALDRGLNNFMNGAIGNDEADNKQAAKPTILETVGQSGISGSLSAPLLDNPMTLNPVPVTSSGFAAVAAGVASMLQRPKSTPVIDSTPNPTENLEFVSASPIPVPGPRSKSTKAGSVNATPSPALEYQHHPAIQQPNAQYVDNSGQYLNVMDHNNYTTQQDHSGTFNQQEYQLQHPDVSQYQYDTTTENYPTEQTQWYNENQNAQVYQQSISANQAYSEQQTYDSQTGYDYSSYSQYQTLQGYSQNEEANATNFDGTTNKYSTNYENTNASTLPNPVEHLNYPETQVQPESNQNAQYGQNADYTYQGTYESQTDGQYNPGAQQYDSYYYSNQQYSQNYPQDETYNYDYSNSYHQTDQQYSQSQAYDQIYSNDQINAGASSAQGLQPESSMDNPQTSTESTFNNWSTSTDVLTNKPANPVSGPPVVSATINENQNPPPVFGNQTLPPPPVNKRENTPTNSVLPPPSAQSTSAPVVGNQSFPPPPVNKNQHVGPPPTFPDSQPPAVQSTTPPVDNGEDEDLGFGNPKKKQEVEDLGFGNPTKRAQTEKPADEKDKKPTEKAETPKSTYSSLIGMIPGIGLFGKKTPEGDLGKEPPKVANLGEKNKFYFDEKLGRWVNGNAGAEAAQVATPPPPPTTPMDSPLSTPQLSGSSPMSRRGPANRRGARNKYVDIMNPDGVSKSTEALARSFLPPPTASMGSETKIFTPKPISQTEASSSSDFTQTAEESHNVVTSTTNIEQTSQPPAQFQVPAQQPDQPPVQQPSLSQSISQTSPQTVNPPPTARVPSTQLTSTASMSNVPLNKAVNPASSEQFVSQNATTAPPLQQPANTQYGQPQARKASYPNKSPYMQPGQAQQPQRSPYVAPAQIPPPQVPKSPFVQNAQPPPQSPQVSQRARQSPYQQYSQLPQKSPYQSAGQLKQPQQYPSQPYGTLGAHSQRPQQAQSPLMRQRSLHQNQPATYVHQQQNFQSYAKGPSQPQIGMSAQQRMSISSNSSNARGLSPTHNAGYSQAPQYQQQYGGGATPRASISSNANHMPSGMMSQRMSVSSSSANVGQGPPPDDLD